MFAPAQAQELFDEIYFPKKIFQIQKNFSEKISSEIRKIKNLKKF